MFFFFLLKSKSQDLEGEIVSFINKMDRLLGTQHFCRKLRDLNSQTQILKNCLSLQSLFH